MDSSEFVDRAARQFLAAIIECITPEIRQDVTNFLTAETPELPPEPIMEEPISFGLPPGITGFTPASGPVGTAVTISGSDFTDVVEVTINDLPAPFTVESNSVIKVTVSPEAETGPLFIRTAGGAAMTDTFFVVTPQPVAAVVLSATPATQSVSAGQSINYSIAISRMNMPNPMEPVTLAVSGLPMGATATFSPNPTTGNSEMLTIMTTASTSGGPSTLTITGTASGATIAPIMVSLTINTPVASVSLAASPTAQSIPAGGNGRYNIMLTRTNFTGAVNLAVSGLPKGATAGFTMNPASSTNAVLMVSTLANTPPGTYVLTVSGTASGVSIAPTTVSLTVATPKGKEKELKERKEKEFEGDKGGKDTKDRLEGASRGGFGFQSTGVRTPMERQATVAMIGDQLSHFIGQHLRPDLELSALKAESDLNRADLAALSRPLPRRACGAKQAKDTKDVEKPREG